MVARKNYLLSLLVTSQIASLAWVSLSQAAIPKPQSPVQVQRQIGGQAGSGFSLMNLQRIEASSKKQERLVFSIGTREGQMLKGSPGYFNAQNLKNRIVIDFAQMPYSRLDEASIRQLFKNSKLVKSVKVAQDPMDQTLTLVLDLNSPVKMKTLQVKGEKQTARVVLDIIKK